MTQPWLIQDHIWNTLCRAVAFKYFQLKYTLRNTRTRRHMHKVGETSWLNIEEVYVSLHKTQSRCPRSDDSDGWHFSQWWLSSPGYFHIVALTSCASTIALVSFRPHTEGRKIGGAHGVEFYLLYLKVALPCGCTPAARSQPHGWL